MKLEEFFKLFEYGLRDVYKNPIVAVIGLMLWLFFVGFSKLSVIVNYKLDNTITISAWLVFFFLVSLGVMSFVFSGLIDISKKNMKEKISIRDFFYSGNKFWFRNFWVMLFIVLVGIVIWAVAQYGATFIGKFFGLGDGSALLVFILIYLIGLLGVLIFISFSSFCLVVYDLKIKESVKRSMKFVKMNYLDVLGMSIILFVALFLLNKIPGQIGEIIEYGFVIPYFAFVLTRFVLVSNKKIK